MARTERVALAVALAALVVSVSANLGVVGSLAPGAGGPNATGGPADPTDTASPPAGPPPSTCPPNASDAAGGARSTPASSGSTPSNGTDRAGAGPPNGSDPSDGGDPPGGTDPSDGADPSNGSDPPNGTDPPDGTGPSNATVPAIRAVHPNPHADGDAGEYVVLALPAGANGSAWSLDDGEDRVRLPAGGLPRVVAVSPDPAAARNLTDRPVVGVGEFALSNAGETLRLRREGTVVDEVAYEDAPEGETRRYGPAADDRNGSAALYGDRWQSVRATDRPVATLSARSVRAFVLPDGAGVPVETLRGADRRILLAGYTLTSRRVAGALRAAADRGVRVRVLVDAAPVGGMPRREAAVLDDLAAAGVEVRAFGGERAPYDFHHPKYAVVDDRALVLTENFEPAGTGGRSSRGWGAVVRSPGVAAELADLFRADARPATSRPWERYRANASLVEDGVADGSYPGRIAPRTLPVDRVRVLAAPDNAERELIELLCSATESVRVLQMTAERGPLLWATMAAARRGVDVRVLLSSARYAREENRRTVRRLNRWAADTGAALEARLAEPRSRFGKVHAKGVVVDGDRVVVGSVNWNNHSTRENREVAVVLAGDRVGGYYARAFDADWRGGAWRLPAGLAALVVATLVASAAVGRSRIDFVAVREDRR